MEQSPQTGHATYKQYPHWARGPARVEDDHVILDEGRATSYYLFESHDRLFALLDVYSPDRLDPNDVVGFVRRYGLLYHGAKDIDSGQCREPLARWRDDLASLNMVAHMYVELVESRKSGLTPRMRETFSFVATPDYPDPTEQECFEAVSVFLAEQITEGMQGTKAGLVSTVGLDVEPRDPATFLLSQLPPNLVAAAYSEFAFLISNKAQILTCPGCGRLFAPKSGKQKYCTQSCASTNRWRRWKDAQSE